MSPRDPVVFHPIGVVHTPFHRPEGTPVQPVFAGGAEGEVHVDPEYAEGLADLDGFSHVVLLFAFHRAEGFALRVKPYLDDRPRGLFATRAPRRPNPIGMSVVRLLAVEGCVLRVAGVDMLDGTPLLDIKPYVPAFDHHQVERFGWLERTSQHAQQAVSDERFAKPSAGGERSKIP